MRNLFFHTLVVLLCAVSVSAQVEPVTGENIEVLGDSQDGDLISRVNAEIDRSANAADEDPRRAFTTGPPADGVQLFLRGIFALCIVLALIMLSYYGVRRWGKRVPLLAGVSLGSVIGRIHLERGTALHFVRTGGRVLLIGINGNSISVVADFDEKSFDSYQASKEAQEATPKNEPFNPDSFLAQLHTSSRALEHDGPKDDVPVDDDEISALRGDIQRLQQYLREESRESQD